jgi:hypothetical protein
MAVQIIRGLVAAIVIIAACPAHGEEEPVCGQIPDLSTNPVIALGHIASVSARVHFLKNSTVPGCPSAAPACSERAYLVPGDHVFVSIRRDAFVCATFVNAKGDDYSGWVPADAVAYDKQEPVTSAGWVGKWSRTEASIRMKPGKAGVLVIEGDATFGALDPARVKRGAVNSGEIAADVMPAGDRLNFAVGENGTLPVDKGSELSCKVWMQRVGSWLIVYDNTNCGGFNVTFRGIYTRKP